MSQYHVWKNSSGSIELVKLGWSWPAFLFGFLWALVKRMTLLGIGMLLTGVGTSFGLSLIVQSDNLAPFAILSILLGTIFGANGNAWREKHLARRAFTLTETIKRSPDRARLVPFSPQMKGLWHDPVWSKVIAVLVLTVLSSTAFFLHHRFADGGTESARYGLREYTSPFCHRAIIRGHVEPDGGAETVVWFEWGETPDLGRTTAKQRFTNPTDYYQHLVGLTETTTYYYRTASSSRYGTWEGRVISFNTSRC